MSVPSVQFQKFMEKVVDMSNHSHRLRKYKRRKDNAVGDSKKWTRLSLLYWRYWFLVHGDPVCLWDAE